MHDIINFLKGAVNRTAAGTVMGCYVVKNGSITARNESMQAGVEMDSEIEFNVPAEEFEAAIARMKTVGGIEFSGSEVTVKGGRLRSTIMCVDAEPPEVPALPDAWSAAPAGLAAALKLATPFLNDSGWSSGVRLMEGRITAIKNTGGIDISLPGLDMLATLLTGECAEFIGAQGDPAEFAHQGTAVVFRWQDGRWLRVQAMNAEMPEMVERILADAGTDAPIEITPEFREAYADAAALSDGTVILHPGGLRGVKGAAQNDIEIEIDGLPAGHASRWQTKVLDPVVACATHWNPAASPKPALFRGPSLRGVVVGIVR